MSDPERDFPELHGRLPQMLAALMCKPQEDSDGSEEHHFIIIGSLDYDGIILEFGLIY